MAISAVNPNLTPSTIGDRRFDLLDVDLELRAPGEAAETGTASETAISLKAEKLAYYKAVVDHSAIGGTVDGSNYWTISIEVSDNNSDFVAVASQQLAAAAGRHYLPLEGDAIAKAMAAAGETEALWVRVTATETGTTAGNLDYTAYLSA